MALKWLRTEKAQKFLREVGGVVLGVLIALGLGAVASEIGWTLEVHNARNALDVELGELIGQGEERVKMAPCIERRLDQIAALVAEAEKTGKLPPIGPISNPNWRTWPRGIWASTVSAQTASHFDRDILDNYSSAYAFADTIASFSDRELEIWTRLSGIVGPGRSFTSAEAIQLRDTIGQARLTQRMMALNGIRLKQIVQAYGLGFDRGSAREYSERPLSEYPICDPIGANPPAAYGQAPFDNIIERANATPIIRR